MMHCKFVTPAMAKTYYKEDYYIGIGSKWYGEGRENLGLDKERIKESDWKQICEGQFKGELLNFQAAKEGKYRTGIDLVFSAPKSVSIASLGDARLVLAHQQAVNRTLDYIQDNLARYRVTENGQTKICKADNLLIGLHQHQLSRELQVHQHTHAVVINTVVCEDGKRRALESGEILSNIKFIGQHYRNELALEVQKLGYQTNINDRSRGFWELKGIDRKVIDSFSLRHQQIQETADKLKERYPTLEDKDRKLMAFYSTKKPKKEPSEKNILDKNSENLRKDHGITPDQLTQHCLTQEKDYTLSQQITPEQAIEKGIKVISESKEMFSREQILNESLKYTLGEQDFNTLDKAFKEQVDRQHLIDLGKTHKGKEVYTTKEFWEMEKDIIKIISEQNRIDNAVLDLSKIDKGIQQQEEELTRQGQQFKYTEQQRDMIQKVLGENQFIKIQGDAGAGKTAALKNITRQLKDAGYNVKLLAPTGTAAEQMKESTKLEAHTIDYFKLKNEDLSPQTVIIVDEAGMPGIKDFHRLLTDAKENQTKIAFIGDEKQIQPIRAGDPFYNLDRCGVARAELTELRRQQTPELKEIAESFKKKQFQKVEKVLKENDMLKQTKPKTLHQRTVEAYFNMNDKGIDATVITKYNKDVDRLNEMIRDKLVEQAKVKNSREFELLKDKKIGIKKKLFTEGYSKKDILIVHKDIDDAVQKGSKLEIIDINKDQNSLVTKNIETGKFNVISTFDDAGNYNVFKKETIKLGEGDRIVFQKNDRLLNNKNEYTKVTNGMMGTIQKIDKNGFLEIETDSDKLKFSVDLNKQGSYQHLQHGYSMTIDKSQGASLQGVVGMIKADYTNDFNNAYTTITRASQDLAIITDNSQKMFKGFANDMRQENIIHKVMDRGIKREMDRDISMEM